MNAITVVNKPLTENIPGQLAERHQWVCWRLEKRRDKVTKVFYTPGTECRASSTDLLTWRTFEEALAAYERGETPYDGIGFVFSSADPFVGIDCDNCRNPGSGKLEPWAQNILDIFAGKATSRPHHLARAYTSSLGGRRKR